MPRRSFFILAVLLVAGTLGATAPDKVLSVEDFFGTFTFYRNQEGAFVNGFIQFNPDHTWYRVTHADTNHDQIPEEVTIERGTDRIVRSDKDEAVLSMTLDNGQAYGTPVDLKYMRGAVETFVLNNETYTRRSLDMPWFDQKKNLKPLASAIAITSVPAGASIWVDGKLQKAVTPLTVDKPTAGEDHVLRAELKGHLPQTRTVKLEEGQRLPVHFELTQGESQLWVRSTPKAHVFVDGVLRGDTLLKLNDIPPGEHVVSMKLPVLGAEYEEKVDLSPEKIIKVSHDFLGRLDVDVGRAVKIFDEGGKKLGEAPGSPIILPIGNNRIVLQDAGGRKKTVFVKIDLDSTTTFKQEFDKIK